MSAEMIVKVESFKEIAGVDYDYKIGKANTRRIYNISGIQFSYLSNEFDDFRMFGVEKAGMFIDGSYYSGKVHIEIYDGPIRTLQSRQINFRGDFHGESTLIDFLGIAEYHKSETCSAPHELYVDNFFSIQIQVPTPIFDAIGNYGRIGLLEPISFKFWSNAISQELTQWYKSPHFDIDLTSKDYIFVTSIGMRSLDVSQRFPQYPHSDDPTSTP